MRRRPLPIAALLLTASVAAQAPSAWSELVIPGGVQSARLQQRGKILAYRDGGTVRVFSGLTRTWDTAPASAQANIRIANDLVLVEDGNRFHAFAAYTGKFAPLSLTGAASVVNPQSQRNDSIVLVQDGTELWSFSGFVGVWTRRTISNRAVIAVQRHVAVVADDRQLVGMSAFRGNWVTTTATTAIAAVSADGSLGIAQGSGEVYGFSAHHNAWRAAPALTGTVGFVMEDDVALWSDGLSLLAFSGPRGTFAHLVTGIAAQIAIADQIAVAHKDNLLWCYSAVTGTWTHIRTSNPPQLSVQDSHALLVDATTVHGFSGPRGSSASLAIRTVQSAASATVAAVLDTSGGALFSALTGTWTRLPAGASSALPRLASTGALVRTATGYAAFSARTGRFHPLATGVGARPHSDASSAILAVEDNQLLAVFETRRETWLTARIRGTTSLQVALWRTCLVAFDGERAFGFGAFHGRIEQFKPTGTFREIHSGSESARLLTGDRIAAFSASPLLSSPWQFPEFRRTFVAGSDLDLHLSSVPANGLAYLALATQAPFALPGLGEVLLDATQLLPAALPMDTRAGTARTVIPVPDLPGLRGLEVFAQALVVPTSGNPYVTDLTSVRLH